MMVCQGDSVKYLLLSGTGDTDMNGTGTFFALFPAASKKLKEQDYRSISPSITLKTVKIYLSRDT